jgi:chromate reductase
MKKLLAFAGSSSKNSINKKLVTYTSNLFNEFEIEILDLNDYEMPIYSADREKSDGIHPLAIEFYNKISQADLLVVSLAEHNGAYSAAFKNIFDWISRHNNAVFQEKNMLLMATSPGARGGKSVLEIAENRFPRNGAKIVGTFSLPNFHDNFSSENGLTNETFKNELHTIVNSIK